MTDSTTKELHIAICTPAYGGQLTTNYTHSLIRTIELFQKFGIKYTPYFLNNESLVQRGRNTLVAQALANPETTHILFMDADITWQAESIIRLIQKDVDIVGGIYPHKHYAWERLVQPEHFQRIQQELNAWKELETLNGNAITSQAFIQKFKSFLLKFNIVFPKDSTNARIEKGFVRVERIATGCMLIKRKVFETMMEKHPEWNYLANTMPTQEECDRLTKYNYAFFDCCIEDNQYLSEDWYFCSQWNKLGGEVWADITMPLSHSGFHTFSGMVSDTLVSFTSRLEQVRQQQASMGSSNTLIGSKEIPVEDDPIARLIKEAEEAEEAEATKESSETDTADDSKATEVSEAEKTE